MCGIEIVDTQPERRPARRVEGVPVEKDEQEEIRRAIVTEPVSREVGIVGVPDDAFGDAERCVVERPGSLLVIDSDLDLSGDSTRVNDGHRDSFPYVGLALGDLPLQVVTLSEEPPRVFVEDHPGPFSGGVGHDLPHLLDRQVEPSQLTNELRGGQLAPRVPAVAGARIDTRGYQQLNGVIVTQSMRRHSGQPCKLANRQ